MHAGEVQPKRPVPVPVVGIPVDPDGLPVLGQRCEGTALLLGPDRVLLRLAERPEAAALIVGVQTANGPPQYFGMDVRALGPSRDGATLVHGQVGGLADALLQPKNLTPRFHFDSMTFTFGFSPRVLHHWEEAGVLSSVVIDRLLLCPHCHGLPTFRHGCRYCGSGRVVSVAAVNGNGHPDAEAEASLLIQVDEEGQPGHVVAPIAVAHPPAYHCQDCHRSDTQLTPIHQCLHCERRFAAQEGFEMVLRGYRAQRLDLTTLPRTT
jgi:hypothetical protein